MLHNDLVERAVRCFSAAKCATLKTRNARLIASLSSCRKMLHNDAVKRAVRRFSATKCATDARAMRAP
eukprot:11196313-Lingulodinium_polyedra.AAC.1